MPQENSSLAATTPPTAKSETARGQTIIEAAIKVIGERGYPAASMKEIARKANVAPGLLHYYFASKEDLLLAVLNALKTEIISDWQKIVADYSDPLERVVSAINQAAVRASRRPESWSTIYDLYTLGFRNSAIKQQLRTISMVLVDGIEVEMRQALADLPAYTVVHPRDVAQAIVAAMDGIALVGLIHEKDPERIYQTLKTMLLALVVSAYVAAGKTPPISRLGELLSKQS